MHSTTWHLMRGRKGQPWHFGEGFTTKEAAETALADFIAQDVIHNRTGEMVNKIFPPTAYREDLTAAGPLLVIPGCERKPIENGKPAQLGLFG